MISLMSGHVIAIFVNSVAHPYQTGSGFAMHFMLGSMEFPGSLNTVGAR